MLKEVAVNVGLSSTASLAFVIRSHRCAAAAVLIADLSRPHLVEDSRFDGEQQQVNSKSQQGETAEHEHYVLES